MQAAVVQYRAKFSGQFPVFDGEHALYCHKKMKDKEASISCNTHTGLFPVNLYELIQLRFLSSSIVGKTHA